MLDLIEKITRTIGAFIGILVLCVMVWQGLVKGARRSSGRTTGQAGKILKLPFLLVICILWVGVCILLWRPFSPAHSTSYRAVALGAGILCYFGGLTLYLWGAKVLGLMYRPSSGFGVQLTAEHQLITHGPFAIVRHPLYLGVQITAVGGLLIYRNWTFLFILINFLGLFLRAKREEEVLAEEFGAEWEQYAKRVPAWLPRIRRRNSE